MLPITPAPSTPWWESTTCEEGKKDSVGRKYPPERKVPLPFFRKLSASRWCHSWAAFHLQIKREWREERGREAAQMWITGGCWVAPLLSLLPWQHTLVMDHFGRGCKELQRNITKNSREFGSQLSQYFWKHSLYRCIFILPLALPCVFSSCEMWPKRSHVPKWKAFSCLVFHPHTFPSFGAPL